MERSNEVRTLALLGNEAMGRGLVEAGCHMALAYPGTPSSEVLPAVLRFAHQEAITMHIEWCANEKVAFEQALSASYCGLRTAVIMKQVGLNVAADPLLSAAYIGVTGGFVVIVADDPGPTSSQTEQDTRLFAHFAKVPVLDPSTPDEARNMVGIAFEISERHQLPVIIRSALRVCHGRQDIQLREPVPVPRKANFPREPSRWAATPRHRFQQHLALNRKLEAISREMERDTRLNHMLNAGASPEVGIVAGGVPFAVLMDLLRRHGLHESIPILKLGASFPFPAELLRDFLSAHRHILVLEETDQLVELLLDQRQAVSGRHDGTVPREGELDAAVVGGILSDFFLRHGIIGEPWNTGQEPAAPLASLELPTRPPTLCPGCPHRASFLAIRRVGGARGIYPSDIGCYTLGVNMGAVDTAHDMGASISMAAGFYHAHALDLAQGTRKPRQIPRILATIGDSTFYHAGLPALADAVYSDARFTLVILDNRVTAMTGMQPTLPSGDRVSGAVGRSISLQETCQGLGVRWIRTVDPDDVSSMIKTLRRAVAHNQAPEGGIAVVIARRPCVIHQPDSLEYKPVKVEPERCNLCGLCIDYFGCPAISAGEHAIVIDPAICVDCGQCVHACARKAIIPASDGGTRQGATTRRPEGRSA